MEEQQKLIKAKKEEAERAAAERAADATSKLNVLDINVEDDFDIDEI